MILTHMVKRNIFYLICFVTTMGNFLYSMFIPFANIWGKVLNSHDAPVEDEQHITSWFLVLLSNVDCGSTFDCSKIMSN